MCWVSSRLQVTAHVSSGFGSLSSAVFSGQKVSNLSELPLNTMTKNTEVITDHGETLVTDLIICCTGLKINSAAYSASFSKNSKPTRTEVISCFHSTLRFDHRVARRHSSYLQCHRK